MCLTLLGTLFASNFWQELQRLLVPSRTCPLRFILELTSKLEMRMNRVLQEVLRSMVDVPQNSWGEMLAGADLAMDTSVCSLRSWFIANFC